MAPLILRKLADKTSETRITKYDEDTGEKKLVNPATPGNDHEPWPTLGVHFADLSGNPVDPPEELTAPHGVITREPTIELVDTTPVVVPAGPPEDPYRVPPHVFLQGSKVVFHHVDGDHEYEVVRSPGKYDTETDEPVTSPADPTTYVTWEYQLRYVGTTNDRPEEA